MSELIQVIYGPPKFTRYANGRYDFVGQSVAWNGWHGTFAWIDDFAWDLAVFLYGEEFDENDLNNLQAAIQFQETPCG